MVLEQYSQIVHDNTKHTGSAERGVVNGLAGLDGSGNILDASGNPALTAVPTYGEMYIYENSNATVIGTADTPIALRQISAGLNSGFTFQVGGSANMDMGASDYSGTVPGAVSFSSMSAHTFNTGDIITIRGTGNYNGIHEVYRISSSSFYVITTWISGGGTHLCDKGSCLIASAGSDGVYTSTWQMTTSPAGACRAIFLVNLNTTPQVKSGAARELAINDEDNNSSTCLLQVSAGDILWLSVQSDSTTDLTNAYGNINIERFVA